MAPTTLAANNVGRVHGSAWPRHTASIRRYRSRVSRSGCRRETLQEPGNRPVLTSVCLLAQRAPMSDPKPREANIPGPTDEEIAVINSMLHRIGRQHVSWRAGSTLDVWLAETRLEARADCKSQTFGGHLGTRRRDRRVRSCDDWADRRGYLAPSLSTASGLRVFGLDRPGWDPEVKGCRAQQPIGQPRHPLCASPNGRGSS